MAQETIMANRNTPSMLAMTAAVVVVARGMGAITPALAHPPTEEAAWIGLVNRCEPALSETEVALAAHRRPAFDDGAPNPLR
jgi:hypothetical protein